jgi:hypothetical protein
MCDLRRYSAGGREPMRGLLKLVLHFVLYVWLRLLFGLVWSSEEAPSNSNSNVERRGSEESLVSVLRQFFSVDYRD